MFRATNHGPFSKITLCALGVKNNVFVCVCPSIFIAKKTRLSKNIIFCFSLENNTGVRFGISILYLHLRYIWLYVCVCAIKTMQKLCVSGRCIVKKESAYS